MLRLYETRAAAVVPFEPAGATVRMYVCGITPYDATHIGHAATFLAYDVLQRRLRDAGLDTQCVRNITDVDDELLARARERGAHYLDVAAGALRTFNRDIAALGLLPAHSEPRATSAISDVRSLVGRLLDFGHAYVSDGSVWFDVTTAAGFGSLSGLDDTAMLAALAGSAAGPPAASGPPAAASGPPAAASGPPAATPKRNPLDFVLWQRAAPDEPSWSSRWGPGRPGWHVECSAMALREMGDGIDLHGGGSDLKFPHHECEQIQAEAATGRPFVRHWMHTGTVGRDGEKMAKSRGNLVFVSTLLRQWPAMAVRLALVANHYRHDWEWDDDAPARAARRLEAWRRAGDIAHAAAHDGDAALDDVRACLDDDLDTPSALAAVDAAAASGHGVRRAAGLLGIAW